MKIFTDDVDHRSIEQLAAVSKLPIVRGHVAAMPDVHAGIGATIGSVIATRSALIPAAVGVDIGCGMAAARLSIGAGDLPESLRGVREEIEDAIPVGFAMHERPAAGRRTATKLKRGLDRILERQPGLEKRMKGLRQKWARQIGTLGGGNHFIELCVDEKDGVWLMLHSGSRGIGNAIGGHFIALAREDMRSHLANLPERDLAYLEEGTVHFADYADAVEWAQEYALENRRLMMRLAVEAVGRSIRPVEILETAVECHHNYVARERHFGEEVYVTRKGAIRAGRGEAGIIPGSMGTRSYIVRGLGSAESLESCAHGAGRRMSRSQARATFSAGDLKRPTEGVECRKDQGVVDEIPGAYKDIDQVMADSADLVEIEATLKQVVCVKG